MDVLYLYLIATYSEVQIFVSKSEQSLKVIPSRSHCGIRRLQLETLTAFTLTGATAEYTAATWPSFFALPVSSLLSISDPDHFSSVPITAAAGGSLPSATCSGPFFFQF